MKKSFFIIKQLKFVIFINIFYTFFFYEIKLTLQNLLGPIQASVAVNKLAMRRENKDTLETKEKCIGCQFIIELSNMKLDSSSGYKDVKQALEETCSYMPDVFLDAVCNIIIYYLY